MNPSVQYTVYVVCLVLQYLHSLMMLQQQKKASTRTDQGGRLGKVEMALEALRNVIKNNPGSITSLVLL